ncbi:MAG: hypothetical protein A3B74_02635 [Candidatus Kerfeldbacteria bacterium RIFCSPHIGHO2_02_FULL_42_14]|uniref:Helix-turn-helix type 11 domain-containing protein n=1 Tax=Candidatus Kerfeldbacteria bacterium RIFCSPHIGHO2_02_FULL_42_14 TaxID=1798540 RepID=A0A1G2ASJ8_9BACT|nr:MAG: hypothetical protein A3B74_02635 [Candidatus Kerfeldbacteria bacterium RIFCSPHIGHO2_02_FULL_42_14]OGY83867.1 MAG: hypothetical protein A3I91_04780 [Candidatus Kerfeldbacteria bacterium RIFCSPLOWO2_02_FULL_42_19]OGY86594.1 MAG: hypothetical protein A3G01_05050 [Candidatus Kerfeldbacteria bacterium RIFCSPLOWO2_12_FULL_43_9]
MTKKEIIWRHILNDFLEGQQIFTQKALAQKFSFSLSTIFNALKIPRASGAIEVSGRNFRVRDFEKFLLFWATVRNLDKAIIYYTHTDTPMRKAEGIMPPNVIFAAFSAYRLKYQDPPADYDKIYVYTNEIKEIEKRFPKKKGYPNLFVLKEDAHLASFGKTTPDVQTFVDIWNLKEWYAKDFLAALKQKMKISV